LRHFEGYLDVPHSRARGTSHLYQQSWLPDDETRAALLLVHGLGEHSSRYEHVARHCTRRGFAIYTLDHYGHGKSDGHKGHVQKFSVYLDGVSALLDKIKQEQPGKPIFLVGHSMGGLIAATYLLDNQANFAGCVLSGPALKTDAAPPGIVLAFNRLLSILVPTAPVVQLDASAVSRDPEVVRAYVSDPLVFHGKYTSRLVSEMTATMRDTLARSADIRLPVMLLHGEDDALTSPAGSRELFENAGSEDKTLKIYTGLYHEVFNEPEQAQVLADMSDWLEAHLP
jgi:alpha-beta hydrolase superfamily lysophospholipase